MLSPVAPGARLLTWLCVSGRLAREHGLHLLYKEEFHNIFQAEREHREFKPLLQRMKVVSASGESQMDEDQWDAASAYASRSFS
jgi:mRNA (guanine-N7-)-methyltransferase